MRYLFRAKKYLSYWLDMVNQHSLHSPHLYDLYTKVILYNDKPIEAIEEQRKKHLADPTIIEYKDLGALNKVQRRRIKEIAHSSLSDMRYSQLYHRLIKYYKPAMAMELGTSLGINTLYLAMAGCNVHTFEGAPEISKISRLNFDTLKADNITLHEGSIDNTLPRFLENQRKVGLIFFDANHTYEATLKYFHWCLGKADEDSIFIFDDIYWSQGMGEAWNEIKSHPEVQVTLDLYRCGIVLFNKSLTRQHLALKW